MKKKTNFDKNVLRVIDANLNRSREGLRVIEDTARFILNDDKNYKSARDLRHKLDSLTREIYPQLLNQRDSDKDYGRFIKEGKREDLKSILVSNFKRVEESLRVLEEYNKLISVSAGSILKEIRFKVYSLEKQLGSALDITLD